ncbi:MAG: CpsD/CapB family tyrosine-protein kinase [Thiotrichales bacterium]
MQKIQKALQRRRMDGGAGYAATPITNSDFDGDIQKSNGFTLKNIDLDSKRLRGNRVFRGDERESFIMAYKMLRTQIYQKMIKNRWQTLGITSSVQGEGKSTTSINLAYALARSVYQTVVLVDMDLRRPSIHSKLGIEPAFGISDYFTDNVPLSEIMFSPGMEGLVIIPGRKSLHNASELISSQKTKQFVNELNTYFPSRFVIYDLPPVLVADDVLAFQDNLDAYLLVTDAGQAKKEDLRRVIDTLQHMNSVGVVLNKFGEVAMNYYGYYGYSKYYY